MDKLHEYEGFAGRIHGVREAIKERWSVWKEWKNGLNLDQGLDGLVHHLRGPPKLERTLEDYSHIYRRKSRAELVRVSAAVMGIEFSYAAETAFVSPTLLKIGVDHQRMTLVWALSPLVGFFVTPILGSMSDRCKLKQGRRRPFILLLAIGVFIGLILVPNGEHIGYLFGDRPSHENETIPLGHRTTAKLATKETSESVERASSHSWGILFTILGTVLLDFDADACQSPARAYLLDVTIPEDHARGLSTFTIMAGLGGFMGYGLGGINWDATSLGVMLGGHVQVTFTLITIIFVICVICTITSFKEIPLEVLEKDQYRQTEESKATEEIQETENKRNEREKIIHDESRTYGALDVEREAEPPKREELANDPQLSDHLEEPISGGSHVNYGFESETNPRATLKEYLMSIIYMPQSLRQVCLTNLFCWMAHVCYSLYFTDFVGEAVYGGNPRALANTDERELYEEGVRFGCWGMSMYSLSCSCYSLIIERLIQRFRARKVYVYGLLFYSVGMLLMALTKHQVGVIVFSWTAGVMYSTLFTMPYLLVAHYHTSSTFALTNDSTVSGGFVRGLGTDVAIVSSMVFLAQFLLSCCLGTIVSLTGSTAAVVYVASVLAMCGAASATRIMYLDL
ncbi:proton-associated sugar transporter A [Nylanderia fulva]|uniref:proton-associated sugar transporter A n=1 Tax=Nylanderia fulva TaxID=613905 RepID=UPI0010FAE387|nr:proton-associated sugar transporter A [Nylanderia fulva]XP_029176912.1 proton-associated sugar transporter A [Nylanderia fulva]